MLDFGVKLGARSSGIRFPGNGFDADAQNFIDTAGITDSTQQAAINNLVITLKDDSIWDPLRIFYPVVGGDASKHSYNLKTPATFQGTWNGGVTHAATGATFNGVNGFFDTTFVDSDEITSLNNASFFSAYRTNVDEAAQDGARNIGRAIISQRSSNVFATNANSTSVDSTASTDARGLKGWFRTASNAVDSNDNGVITSTTTASTAFPTGSSYYFGARNNNGLAQTFSSKEWVGGGAYDKGLNSTEQGNLIAAFDAFNTALSRQTW